MNVFFFTNYNHRELEGLRIFSELMSLYGEECVFFPDIVLGDDQEENLEKVNNLIKRADAVFCAIDTPEISRFEILTIGMIIASEKPVYVINKRSEPETNAVLSENSFKAVKNAKILN